MGKEKKKKVKRLICRLRVERETARAMAEQRDSSLAVTEVRLHERSQTYQLISEQEDSFKAEFAIAKVEKIF